MTVTLQPDMRGVLAASVISADGKRRIPAGAHVRFEFNPEAGVAVHPVAGDEAVVASMSELWGSEVRNDE